MSEERRAASQDYFTLAPNPAESEPRPSSGPRIIYNKVHTAALAFPRLLNL
ncbi:UNVERIFIED_CONTAM: hypothetical protein FKN15_003299 [Acipenser sinensis]